MPEAGTQAQYAVKNQDILLFKGDTQVLSFRLKTPRGGIYPLTGKTVHLAAKTNIRHTATVFDIQATSTTGSVAKFTITSTHLATAREYLILELYVITTSGTLKKTVRQFDAAVAETVK